MKVLIVPFAKAMRGGEDHPEQVARIITAYNQWYSYFVRDHDVQILCSSGLANSQGISLARTLSDAFRRLPMLPSFQMHLRQSILIGEQESTHTGENIRLSKSVLESGYDLVICVSSPGFLFLPGHVDRIKRLMRNTCPDVRAEFVPCKPCGSWLYRLVRGITELILIAELWFDPEASFFDRSHEKRIHEARSKP